MDKDEDSRKSNDKAARLPRLTQGEGTKKGNELGENKAGRNTT